MARLYGYSVAGDRTALEPALAYIERTLRAAPVLPNEAVVPLATVTDGLDIGTPDQSRFGAAGVAIVPTPETLLPPQLVYDIGTACTRFWRDPDYDADQLRSQIGRFFDRGGRS